MQVSERQKRGGVTEISRLTSLCMMNREDGRLIAYIVNRDRKVFIRQVNFKLAYMQTDERCVAGKSKKQI